MPPEQKPTALSLQLPAEVLEPLIQRAVEAAILRLEAERVRLGDRRLYYSEEEAAALLGVPSHVLRDERRRKRIAASSIVSRRIRYLHSDLVEYLLGRRCEKE
jgi:hypothetical protein